MEIAICRVHYIYQFGFWVNSPKSICGSCRVAHSSERYTVYHQRLLHILLIPRLCSTLCSIYIPCSILFFLYSHFLLFYSTSAYRGSRDRFGFTLSHLGIFSRFSNLHFPATPPRPPRPSNHVQVHLGCYCCGQCCFGRWYHCPVLLSKLSSSAPAPAATKDPVLRQQRCALVQARPYQGAQSR